MNKLRTSLCSIVEIHGNDDKCEGETEVEVQLKVEDDDGQCGSDKHCTRDEEQTRDVARMFHYRGHYQTDHRLTHNRHTQS